MDAVGGRRRGCSLSRRRNRVSHGDARWVVAVAVLGGVVGAALGARPTVDAATSALLTGGLVAVVAWASATAPWWAIAATGAITAAAAGPWWAIGVAAAAFAAGAVLGSYRRSWAPLRAAAGAAVGVACQRLDVGSTFGLSAALAGLVLVTLSVVGIARRPRAVRRRVIISALAVSGVAVVAAAASAASAVSARSTLEAAANHLEDGLSALGDGDTTAAASSLRTAAGELSRASDRINAWWARPGRLVPVVSQHVGTLDQLSDTAAAIAASLADTAEVTDLDGLTIRNGTIDPVSVAVLAGPLADVRADVEQLAATLDERSSGWLVGPVKQRIGDFADDAARVERLVGGASDVADLGDQLLGVDRPVRYLLVFASPAESRGSGGVIGNWAEITVSEGRLSRTGFGRTNDLIEPLRTQRVQLDMPEEYLDRYGSYGATSNDGAVAAKFWSNITMSPHFPSVGDAIAQLYAAATGTSLDGVVLLDPTGLAGLVEATGPVSIEGVNELLSADSLEQFLLVDQYQLQEADRERALEATAQAVTDALLTGDLPPAQQLARILRPGFANGHILTWLADDAAEQMLGALGIDGAIDGPDGTDGLAVIVNNAAGNKIDSFLRRTVRYDAAVDGDTGTVAATATITLANDAPTSGYADYVVGNLVDLPRGTNRLLVSVYTPLELREATAAGEPIGMSRTTEQGWNVYTAVIEIASRSEVVLIAKLEGEIVGDYELLLHPQPLSVPPRSVVTVVENGQTTVNLDRRFTAPVLIDDDGTRRAR